MVLFVGVVIAIPFLVPPETFKEDITAGIEDAAARPLDITDKMSLLLYQLVAIGVDVVMFANALAAFSL